MIYDFITIDKNEHLPLYRQIYINIKNSIENGSLKKGYKLPSIRRLSSDLNVSKTTINSAYEQLCAEGYICNKPQIGYFIEAQFDNIPKQQLNNSNNRIITSCFYEYDFSGRSIDENIININDWKKYIKEVLNNNYLLTTYGESQGELKLRTALQKYSLGIRSVNTTQNNIVIGAGTQPLLNILCSLLKKNITVATSATGYVQSEYVFKSYGYKIKRFKSDENGVSIKSLNEINPNIVLINPNFSDINGKSMPITRRLELIKWAKQNDCLIIEDDYNGELRYSTHPIPCVQNYGKECTIYLGSFSKVLLPSVRISYMVLPDYLLNEYIKIKEITNQTASKVEQIALANYLTNKRFERHLRKARRVYLEKSKIIFDSLNYFLPNNYSYIFNETSLYLKIYKVNGEKIKILNEYFDKNSICVMKIKENCIYISFSGIDSSKINDGINLICQALKNEQSNC